MSIIDLDDTPVPDYFSDQVRTARRFFRPGAHTSQGAGYQVVSGGMEICVPGYDIDRRGFRYWAVELVASGRGLLKLNGREFNLIPGAVYAYGPEVSHRIRADKGESLTKFFVDVIVPDPPPDSFAVLKGPLISDVLYSRNPDSLIGTFDEIIGFGGRPSVASGLICSHLFEVILHKVQETTIGGRLTESAAFNAYRRCRSIIERGFLELNTIGEIASRANVDVSYLCRLFKRFDGQTPYNLLTRLKMNHAAGLLFREGASVKRVAAESGYEDSFTFSKRFKAVMGCSPRQFTVQYGMDRGAGTAGE